ncbi:MAG: hypothetical protein ACI8TQ_000755 [Planctomycetota bacterium]|jgi:uncharacterized protein (DUF58 family)
MNPDLLPSPLIKFAPDFLRRVGALTGRLVSSSQRREGRGNSTLFGSGEEFVGYRAYRAGEDLRLLDWSLLARLDQPLVRVCKREASEEWCVVLDTSASMGIGIPGKLQVAAEVAVAVTALGARAKARVTVWTTADTESRVVRRTEDVASLMRWIETKRASSEQGLRPLLPKLKLRGVGRVFLLGDFFDVDLAAVQGIRRPGQELFLLRILAQEELVPELSESTEWVDAETGAVHRVRVDSETRNAYELELSHELESWREFSAKHRIGCGCFSSTTAFESIVQSVLSPN